MEELLSINLKPSTRRMAVAILEMYANHYSEVNIDQLAKFLDEIKSEARKEFAERLKAYKQKPEFPWDEWFVAESDINYLLAEMENSDNG